MSGEVYEARGIDVRRGGALVLRGASIEIRPGRVHGVVGPNGAGKSTLLRALAVTLPSSGVVRFGGRDMRSIRSRSRARIRAMLPQDASGGDDLRVRELVMMGRYPHRPPLAPPSSVDAARVRDALERVGLAHLGDRGLRSLSGGQRRLAFIAKAIAQDPRFLLLDEPLASLDPFHQLEVIRLIGRIAAAGVGVGVVIHDLELASRVCDVVTVVAHGAVVATGRPSEVITPETLAGAYRVDARVRPDPETGGLRIALLGTLPPEKEREP
ncbi:ABC transporter ATP-binding protein [Microbacterium indicum]|uniref:ABC transporter ATP-binding protein n=1 Tax=Microbacterium indicum TaxID=358100 RepID=UPI00041FB5D1|nr:ABC transporter ATP-binding protein [Microbacterium indicum]